MGVLCRYCGNRVASVASLAGHYRRKHPERVPARRGLRAGYPALPVTGPHQPGGIASHTATKGLSDSAYIARLAEIQGSEKPSLPMEIEAGKGSSAAWWLPWALLAAVWFFFAFSSDSGSGERADSGLLSTYQPHGDGQ